VRCATLADLVKNETFRPFRHRQYTIYWSGNFISNIGTWMETVALGAFVAQATHKASWSGLIAAAGFLPTGLLSPVGGVVADRYPRRPVLIASTLVQMVGAGLLAWLAFADHLTPGIIVPIVFVSGCAGAIGFPAYQAAVRDLVPPEDLTAAIGLGSAQWNLGRIVGPALAGIVIAFGSIGWALVINTVSFLAVVITLLLITLTRPKRSDTRGGWLDSLSTGYAFVRREPGLRVSMSAMAVNTFFAAPFIALVPAVVEKTLRQGKGAVSLLVTCQGIGAVVAAVSLGRLTRQFGVRRLLTFNLVAVPAALIVYGLAPGLAGKAVALVFLGAAYLLALSTFSSVSQLRAPAELRGRTVAVNTTILGLLYPAGSLVQGRLGDRFGLNAVTAGAGALMLGVVVVARLVRPGITSSLAEPTPAAR
jgi:MFS family permease